jgi:hypothetical protein
VTHSKQHKHSHKKMFIVGLVLLSLIFLLSPVLSGSNLYFYVSQTEPSCFIDELSAGATLFTTYKHDEFSVKPLLIIVSYQGDVVASTKITAASGKFAHAAAASGEYRLCIIAEDPNKPWSLGGSRSTKFYFKSQILINTSDEEAEELAKHAHVVPLEQELQIVSNAVDLLLYNIELAREKETHFREQSEIINSHVVWWSIAQTIFLVIVGAFQSVHLHNFFLVKKIA